MNKEHTPNSELIADPRPSIKAALKEAMKGCRLSREQIADEMNRLGHVAGIITHKVTRAAMEGWVAPSKLGNEIPLKWLAIFCRVVENNLPLRVYAEAFSGARVVSEEEYQILMWAKTEIQARQAKKQARRLAQNLEI